MQVDARMVLISRKLLSPRGTMDFLDRELFSSALTRGNRILRRLPNADYLILYTS